MCTEVWKLLLKAGGWGRYDYMGVQGKEPE